MKKAFMHAVSLLMIFALIAPFEVISSVAEAQDAGAKPVFKQEELDQMLAPIALYPDSLLTQMLMASTYPLEVVQADRWAKKNKALKGDALTKELEKQDWDPSVKSLVNFPDILAVMSEKIDLTQKLGDAFLAQQKEVMATIQKLRHKAQEAGNLKTTKEQVVKVEREVIIIESASPQVVYVPSYNPTVVYGTWAYPAYPPYPYYPYGYGAAALFTGVAIGAAWGYSWGHSDWHGGDVDIDYNRNTNINNNIDRSKYKQQAEQSRQQRQGERQQGQADRQAQRGDGQRGQGSWQHNPEHRKGAAYRDQGTAQKYNRASTNDAIKSRENFRGRADAGRQDLAKGGADGFRGGQGASQRDVSRGGGGGGSAFSGMDRGGASTRDMSSRGSSSRGGSSFSGGGGGSRGGGGGSRGGGGGSRGGGGGGRR